MYVRSGYLAALMLVLLWHLLAGSGSGALGYRDLAQAGAASFASAAYVQLGLICVLGPAFVAGAIARESDPRTWDVLLTTPMGALEIVLGHLLGRVFFALALLASGLPVFALTQYFGGVSGQTLVESYAVAGATVVAVGSVAIMLAACRAGGRRMAALFYVAVVGYLAITAAGDAWLRHVARLGAGASGTGASILTATNPFLALSAALNPSAFALPAEGEALVWANARWTPGPLSRWAMSQPVAAWCLGSMLVSVVMMALAAGTVRQGGLIAWLRGEQRAERRGMRRWSVWPGRRRDRPVWMNPVAWREAVARHATPARLLTRWGFVAVGVIWAGAMPWLYHTGRFTLADFRLALLTTVLAESLLAVLIATHMSATAVTREREDGTLDLLLITPLTPQQYVGGKVRGLMAYLGPILAVPVITLGLAGGSVGWAQWLGDARVIEVVPPHVGPIVLPEGGLLLAAVLGPLAGMCVMIGLGRSVGSAGTIGAVVRTVGIVGAIVGVTGACGWSAAGSVPLLGPVLGGAAPASLTFAIVQPIAGMRATVDDATLDGARVCLATGALVAGGVYLLVVWSVYASLVRTFDMTVRQLAGTR